PDAPDPSPPTPPTPITPSLPTPPPACRISQFFCLSGEGCVPLDRFCDGHRDCEDKSDEPRHCSPCNRTYWGESGESYELEVRRPAEDALPFHCMLNFTAAGGQHGDIVQITFLSFAVGTFAGWGAKADGGVGGLAGEEGLGGLMWAGGGCPDGGVGVAEAGLPPTGGLWCGTAWGHSTYFSETHSVALYLTLLRLPAHQHFHFRLSYRFLKKSDATARYGEPFAGIGGPSWMAPLPGGLPAASEPSGAQDLVHRGHLVPGTYCDRVFRECHRLRCRIQSPNFPGMYPRNASCTYTVEAGSLVPGMHATVAVLQRAGQKVHLKEAVDGDGGDGEGGGRVGGGLGRGLGGGGAIPGGGGLRGAIGNGRMASGAAIFKRRQRVLRSWAECGEGKGEGSAWRGRDALTFAEAKTTATAAVAGGDERVLLRLCGGGEEAVEAVVSSGPSLQIKFASSAFDNPFHPIPLTYLPGFELEVQPDVKESDWGRGDVGGGVLGGVGGPGGGGEFGGEGAGGMFFRLRPIPWPARMRHLATLPDYRPPVRFRPDGSGGGPGSKSWCYFLVTGGKGEVESPRHTIPPNTLCLYVFRAEDQESSESGGVAYPGGGGFGGGGVGRRLKRKKRSLSAFSPFSVEAPRGEGEDSSEDGRWRGRGEETNGQEGAEDEEEEEEVLVVEERRVWISFSKFHAAPSALGSEERLPTRRRLFAAAAAEEEGKGGAGGKRSKGGGWAGARPECMAGGMRIFDGEVGPEEAEESQLPPLLGEFCRDDAPPRLCDHSHLVVSAEENAGSQPGHPNTPDGFFGARPRIRLPARPCRLPTESYLSSGRSITLSLRYGSGSALFPLAFRLRYEFVSVEMRSGERGGGARRSGEGGEGGRGGGKHNESLPWNIAPEMEEEIPRDTEDTEPATPPLLDPGSISCNHLFKGPKRQRPSLARDVILRRQDPPFQGRTPLHSPRSVFLFGRGGRRDISCITHFEPRKGQRLVLELGEVRMGSGGCHSERDPYTGRWQCIRSKPPEDSVRRDPLFVEWSSDSSIVGILRGHAKTSSTGQQPGDNRPRTGFDPGGGFFEGGGFRRAGIRRGAVAAGLEGGEGQQVVPDEFRREVRIQRSIDEKREEEGQLWFSEFPWPGVRMPMHCLCGVVDGGITIDSETQASELNFSAAGMAPWQDQRSFRYSGWMRFEEGAPNRITGCAEGRRVSGPSGTLSRAEADPCGGHPWLLEPSSAGVFLHLRIAGRAISWNGDGWHPEPSPPSPPPHCPRGQRAFVTRPGLPGRLVVCPSSVSHLRFFSGGWPHASRWDAALTPPLDSAFVFEFEEFSGVSVEWLEVIPGHSEQPPASSLSAQGHPAAAAPDAAPQASACPTLCPEIPACVSPELWCDGTPHCPSGADEALCGARGRPPAPPRPSSAAEEAGVTLYAAVAVGGGVAAMGAVTLLLVAVASAARRGRRGSRVGRKEKKVGGGSGRVGRGGEEVGRVVGTLVDRGDRGEVVGGRVHSRFLSLAENVIIASVVKLVRRINSKSMYEILYDTGSSSTSQVLL
ncbi:uncharacterized protein, partial [Hetaerina americana]|uniref:uncharacterized protein n=1 Tax=Hetaerina americana TaxID=62018 RepID=UPI003A7F2D4A